MMEQVQPRVVELMMKFSREKIGGLVLANCELQAQLLDAQAQVAELTKELEELKKKDA